MDDVEAGRSTGEDGDSESDASFLRELTPEAHSGDN
jgi:hypothetical protein